MPGARDGKHAFACGVCKKVVRRLPCPEIFVNEVVRFFIRSRCESCEHSGRISKGEKQIFHYLPDAPVPIDDELVPALAKYV